MLVGGEEREPTARTRVSELSMRDAETGASLFTGTAGVSTSEGSRKEPSVVLWSEISSEATSGKSSSLRCVYRDDATGVWSERGLVEVGRKVVGGRVYVGCGSNHLSSFMGVELAVEVSVNAVDPIGDASNITVCMVVQYHDFSHRMWGCCMEG